MNMQYPKSLSGRAFSDSFCNSPLMSLLAVAALQGLKDSGLALRAISRHLATSRDIPVTFSRHSTTFSRHLEIL